MGNYNRNEYSINQDVKDPSLRRFLKESFATAVLIGSSLPFLTGCEDSPNHNFGDNDSNIVLALGDSITLGDSAINAVYPDKLEELIGKNVINVGRCGETSVGGAGRVSGLLTACKPGYLAVMYGTNDAHFGVDYETSKTNLRTIIQTAQNQQTRVIIGTAIPHPARNSHIIALNQIIRNLASEEGASLADVYNAFEFYNPTLYANAVHPNEAGCNVIARCFADRF